MVCDLMGFWNIRNYVYDNRICMLGCGNWFNGRIPVGIGRKMELA